MTANPFRAAFKEMHGVWRHFKGDLYDVCGFMYDAESGQPMVWYHPNDPDRAHLFFSRPLAEFMSLAPKDAEQTFRFERVPE